MRKFLIVAGLAMAAGFAPLLVQAEAPKPTAPKTAPAPVAANAVPAGNYTLEKTHASLIWKINHMGLSNYTARFTKFDVELYFDPANVEKSTVKAVIDPLSVETDFRGTEDFNKKVSTDAGLLNASKFPKITFESVKITKTGANKGVMVGNLTMLGVTKPVALDVVFNGGMAAHPFAKVPAVGFSASGRLKRSEFGMTYGIPNVGDSVLFVIEAEFLAKK